MAEAYPLAWPQGWVRTPTWKRQFSRFKLSGFGKARDLLFAEIRRMGGSQVVLSSNLSLRLDGIPYANQRQPEDGGVAVYFLYKGKQMSFACDHFRKVEENAYAIAKTIEALRGIERWGASDMMERAFRGFAALGDGTVCDWRSVLGFTSTESVRALQINERYRELAKTAHPDAGGSVEQFQALVKAKQDGLAAVDG